MRSNSSKLNTYFQHYHVTGLICHGFRLIKRDDYFPVTYGHVWSESHLKTAKAVTKIDSSLEPLQHKQI